MAVFISSSKTDQEEIGAPRPLYESDSVVRHVKNMREWAERTQWNTNSDIPLFGTATLEKLRSAIKWDVLANQLPVERFSLHSLRIGGATCLFLQDVPLGDIRKYGRWKTTSANIYLYFDDVVFRNLGQKFVVGQGVLRQLQMLRERGVAARTSSKYVNLQQPVHTVGGELFTDPSYVCGGQTKRCEERKRSRSGEREGRRKTKEMGKESPPKTAVMEEEHQLADSPNGEKIRKMEKSEHGLEKREMETKSEMKSLKEEKLKVGIERKQEKKESFLSSDWKSYSEKIKSEITSKKSSRSRRDPYTPSRRSRGVERKDDKRDVGKESSVGSFILHLESVRTEALITRNVLIPTPDTTGAPETHNSLYTATPGDLVTRTCDGSDGDHLPNKKSHFGKSKSKKNRRRETRKVEMARGSHRIVE